MLNNMHIIVLIIANFKITKHIGKKKLIFKNQASTSKTPKHLYQ